MIQRLQRCNAKRLRDRRHHVKIRHLIKLTEFIALQKTRKRDLMPDPHLSGQLDRPVHHIPGPSHHEPDIIVDLKNFFRRRQKVFRPLLHRYPADKEHDLFILNPSSGAKAPITAAIGLDTVINHLDLLARHTVTVHDHIPRILAHRDHPVRRVHTGSLDLVDLLVDMLAAAVKFRRMNLNHQRFAAHRRRRHPRRKSHPVVGMDHVETLTHRQPRRRLGIAIDLRIHVPPVVHHILQHLIPLAAFAQAAPLLAYKLLNFLLISLRTHIGLEHRLDCEERNMLEPRKRK